MPVVDLQNPVSFQLLLTSSHDSQEEQEIMEGVTWLLGLRHCKDFNFVPPKTPIMKTTTTKLSQTTKALRGGSYNSSSNSNYSSPMMIDETNVGKASSSNCGSSSSSSVCGTSGSVSPLRGETVNLGVQDINKKRKRATREEVAVLRRAFAINPLPPLEVRSRIAQQLNWTPRKVKIWFQNERAKIRKRSRELQDPSASTPDRVRTPDSSLDESISSPDERSITPKISLLPPTTTPSPPPIPAFSFPSPIPSYGISHLRDSTPSPVSTTSGVTLESPLSTSRIHHGISLFTAPGHSLMTPSFLQRAPSEVQVL